jgi:hypothetical protein
MQRPALKVERGVLPMKYRTWIYCTDEKKALMWDRWQESDSIHDIARLFDRYHSPVQGIFARCVSIRSPIRRRSERSLKLAEREEISHGFVAGRSLRSISWRLDSPQVAGNSDRSCSFGR